MKRISLLVSIFVGTMFYVAFNLFFGVSGLWAEKQLVKQRNSLSANVAAIEKINDELELECNAFLVDDELIASYARKLGYVSEGEYIVKIEGLNYTEHPLKIGKPYIRDDLHVIPDWIAKVLGIVVFFICLILSIAFEQKDNSLENRAVDSSADENSIKDEFVAEAASADFKI